MDVEDDQEGIVRNQSRVLPLFSESYLIPKAFIDQLLIKKKKDSKDDNTDDIKLNKEKEPILTSTLGSSRLEVVNKRLPRVRKGIIDKPQPTVDDEDDDDDDDGDPKSNIQRIASEIRASFINKSSEVERFLTAFISGSIEGFGITPRMEMMIDGVTVKDTNIIDILHFLYNQYHTYVTANEHIQSESYHEIGVPKGVRLFLSQLSRQFNKPLNDLFGFDTSRLKLLHYFKPRALSPASTPLPPSTSDEEESVAESEGSDYKSLVEASSKNIKPVEIVPVPDPSPTRPVLPSPLSLAEKEQQRLFELATQFIPLAAGLVRQQETVSKEIDNSDGETVLAEDVGITVNKPTQSTQFLDAQEDGIKRGTSSTDLGYKTRTRTKRPTQVDVEDDDDEDEGKRQKEAEEKTKPKRVKTIKPKKP
jgi:hypothetical protein